MIFKKIVKKVFDFRRNKLHYPRLAKISPMIEQKFSAIKTIPGWFNVDDIIHFHMILNYQNHMEIKGDLLEIGSYHGRSTMIMSDYLRKSERIHICDAFENETEDTYTNKPTEESFLRNITKYNIDINRKQIAIHNCYSSKLELDDSINLRFVHIDGGHSYKDAMNDLEKVKEKVVVNGIIVVDDYFHPKYIEVKTAVDDFLEKKLNFRIFADLNRSGAIGRKIYLIKIDN